MRAIFILFIVLSLMNQGAWAQEKPLEKRPLVQRHEKVTGSMREDSIVGDSANDTAQSANLAMGALYNAKDEAAYEQALTEVQRLVDAGNMEAAFRLGRYFDLEIPEPDMNRAMSLYRMAAAKGHPWATNNIGYAFERAGEYDQALQYYKKASDLGEFHAYNSLARLYFTGKGVPRDQATGFAWLEQGMAKNIPEVYTQTAQIYYFGQYGVPEDYKKALYYYTKGGELGDREAKWSAAKMYLEGDNIPVNGKLGMKMLNELAALNDAQAINSIGAIHADGKAGFPVDKKKAVEYWEKSANLGFCLSMMNLSAAYDNGWGVTQDVAKATSYITSAVKCGNPPDGFNVWKLGTRYSNGFGIERDCNVALDLYKKSVLLGYAPATVDAGYMLENGCDSIKPDLKEAFKFYLFGAKLGVPLAQNNVGAMLKHGKGVAAIDRPKAYAWLKLAAENGNDVARQNLEDFKGMFKRDDRAAGEAHLQEIKQMIAAAANNYQILYDPGY